MVIIILIIWGLCLGSFVNALVWRLHAQQQKPRTKKKLTKKQLSITKGRSVCTSCGHQLAVADLVPIFSWLFLKGKCRYCHEKIDDSPLVELVTAGLFVMSYLAWPYGFTVAGTFYFLIWLVCVVGFMALILFDIRWFLLPDKIVLPLTILIIGHTTAQLFFGQAAGSLPQLLGSCLILCGLFGGLYAVSGGKWLGFGDVKLSLLLGLLAATPLRAVLLIFVASCSGVIISLPLLITKKLKASSHIPFGPFLLFACVLVVLWGPTLEHWIKDYIFVAY